MHFAGSLNQKKEQEEVTLEANEIKEISPKVKFTTVMGEVLLLLIIFFLVSGEERMKEVVKDLQRVLKRSKNAVGTSLKELNKLALIQYERVGPGRVVTLNIAHEFNQSLMVRLFGMNIQERSEEDEGCWEGTVGCIPDNSDFELARQMFEDRTKVLEEQIMQYQTWLDWIENQEHFEEAVKEEEEEREGEEERENPAREIAEGIVICLEKAQEYQVNALGRKEVFKVIKARLEGESTGLPWEEEKEKEQRGGSKKNKQKAPWQEDENFGETRKEFSRKN